MRVGDSMWDDLARVAGDPLFMQASSDMVAGGGSELFQMCSQVFAPMEKLREEMLRQLRAWATTFARRLSIVDVERSVPSHLHSRHAESMSVDPTPSQALLCAIALCDGDGFDAILELFSGMSQVVFVWAAEPAS